jgi:hypothetical protein
MNEPVRSHESPSLNPARRTFEPMYVPSGTCTVVLRRPSAVLPFSSIFGTSVL